MLHIRNLEEGVELFKVLGSDIRVNIILLLLKEKEMNMNEIAARLQITNGALTSHVRKLEEAGLIRVTQDSAGHGNQKVCSVLETRILVEIGTQEETGEGSIFRAEIPVGQYSDYQVFPTCGISTTKKMIGEVDDPRYFAHPDRVEPETSRLIEAGTLLTGIIHVFSLSIGYRLILLPLVSGASYYLCPFIVCRRNVPQ